MNTVGHSIFKSLRNNWTLSFIKTWEISYYVMNVGKFLPGPPSLVSALPPRSHLFVNPPPKTGNSRVNSRIARLCASLAPADDPDKVDPPTELSHEGTS